jgi:hypothetical protein
VQELILFQLALSIGLSSTAYDLNLALLGRFLPHYGSIKMCKQLILCSNICVPQATAAQMRKCMLALGVK